MSRNSDGWEHVDTQAISTADQLLGDSSSIYVFENKETGERRKVTAYDLDHAGRKIADGDFSD